MRSAILAALQLGSSPGGTSETLERALAFEPEITAAGCTLVVMPEALLGGYPKGSDFGTRLGYRLAEGREAYGAYWANAVDLPGPETEALEGLARRTGAFIVAGVIERARATLYCTAVFIDPDRGLVARRRKLMPTGAERLIWGQGDGSTLPVVESRAGWLGAAICWENSMPMLRMAMYAKGVEVWCAPTVDHRDSWQATMRHIAQEGRCFVVSACQVMDTPEKLGREAHGWPGDEPLIRGGSVIVGPLGEVLAGPLLDAPGLVTAKVDLDEVIRSRFDFDAAGHYARPDVFRLEVDETPRPAVAFRRKDEA
jgi:nitrilase